MKTVSPHQRVFEITEDDIANGIARKSDSCPIAEVIDRTLPSAEYVMVDLAFIRWSDRIKGKRYIFETPRNARQFIVDFDRGDIAHLQPFTMKLPAPMQILERRERKVRDRAREYEANKIKRRNRRKVIMNAKREPTIIGGQRKPAVANVRRTRLFGVRDLIE